MKSNSNLLQTVLMMVGVIGLCSCDQYRVSVNDNDLTYPRELFEDYNLKDPHLQKCVAQAIADQTIQQASGLRRLNCSAMGIRSLAGLEVFSGLNYLNLKGNTLGGITPLLMMQELEEVEISDNPALLCREVNQLKRQVKKVSAPECDSGT